MRERSGPARLASLEIGDAPEHPQVDFIQEVVNRFSSESDLAGLSTQEEPGANASGARKQLFAYTLTSELGPACTPRAWNPGARGSACRRRASLAESTVRQPGHRVATSARARRCSERSREIKRPGPQVPHDLSTDSETGSGWNNPEDGRNSRRRKYRKVVRERPGLAPGALFHLIGNTVFLLLSSMDSEKDGTGYSQRSAYDTVFEELRKELAEALKSGSKRLLATYLQTLLAYPDGCTRGETVFDPRTGDVIVQVPPLSEDRLYPKETGIGGPGGGGTAGRTPESAGLRHPHRNQGHHRADGWVPDPARLPGGGAEGRHGGPGKAGSPGWRTRVKQGVDVVICHPKSGADRAGPYRLPNALLVREVEFSVFQSDRKMYGSHGRSIWRQLELNRWQQTVESAHP